MLAVVVDVPRHVSGERPVDRDAPVEVEYVGACLVRGHPANKQ